MTAASLWSAQAALFARLNAAPALLALLAGGAAGLSDHPPANPAFPHVVLDALQARPQETQDMAGHDIIFTIRSYSRYDGMKELRAVMDEISAALHGADFPVVNHALILCRETGAETATAADGLTREGLQRFRLIIEPL
jgi:hypothetical protein